MHGVNSRANSRQPVGRLVHRADFERTLAAPPWSRSAHFAVHHVASGPTQSGKWDRALGSRELSTTQCEQRQSSVDKLLRDHWLGVLAPKRHAKRAVTRNLLKRQMRSAFALHFEKLPPGLWLLRLRSPFATRVFPSARSVALAAAMRAELVLLLMRTKAPCPPN